MNPYQEIESRIEVLTRCLDVCTNPREVCALAAALAQAEAERDEMRSAIRRNLEAVLRKMAVVPTNMTFHIETIGNVCIVCGAKVPVSGSKAQQCKSCFEEAAMGRLPS